MGTEELSLSLTAEVGLCVYFAGLIRREILSLVVPRGAREAGVHLSLQKEEAWVETEPGQGETAKSWRVSCPEASFRYPDPIAPKAGDL